MSGQAAGHTTIASKVPASKPFPWPRRREAACFDHQPGSQAVSRRSATRQNPRLLHPRHLPAVPRRLRPSRVSSLPDRTRHTMGGRNSEIWREKPRPLPGEGKEGVGWSQAPGECLLSDRKCQHRSSRYPHRARISERIPRFELNCGGFRGLYRSLRIYETIFYDRRRLCCCGCTGSVPAGRARGFAQGAQPVRLPRHG